MPTTKKSTLVLVAERAGVSTASVSRVLNGLPASEALSARVRKAVDDLGYVPDAMARSLKVGKTEQIALAVADVGNPVYVTMMREIARVVGKKGFRLVVSSTGSEVDDQVELVGSLGRGYADGLVLIPLRITDALADALRSSRLPIVVIGSLPDDIELDNVRADSSTGIRLAVDHLVERGRRHIAFVNGPVDTVPGAARLGGYLRAIEANGLATNADMQVEGSDFTYKAGRRAAAKLFEQCTPDAVVCANDLLAVAVEKEATARGIRIPEQLAIVGMDNSDAAELANPSITSVELGSRKRAHTAAKLLLRRLENRAATPQREIIEPTLVVRESTGGPA